MNDYIKCNFLDPFSLYPYNSFTKSRLQEYIDKHGSKINILSNFAISCNCGSGKTLAGILLMSKVNLQTLIISTRSAINYQWRDILLSLYKDIIIRTNEGYFIDNNKYYSLEKLNKKLQKEYTEKDISVYIYSPQYLSQNENKFPISCGLIIYDEIHSLLSKEFSKVLSYPFTNVIYNKTKELPYMLSLSATYPSTETEEYKNIIKIFGKIKTIESNITKINILVHDIRETIKKQQNCSDDVFDTKYIPLDEFSFITKIVNNKVNFFNNYIENTIVNHKELSGFVITSEINISVYAWLMFYNKYKVNCCLIRENDNGCYILKNNIPQDILERKQNIKLEDILHHVNFNDFVIRTQDYKHSSLMFGTYQRLKEGISVENAVFGICSKFVWSIISRIQILGRIRRLSNNININNYQRYFLVNSFKIPTNIGQILHSRRNHYRKPIKLQIDYNLEEEKERFRNEHYEYV